MKTFSSSPRLLAGAMLMPLFAAFALTPVSAGAAESVWPVQFDAPEAVIVIYQPQAESLEGDVVKGRAAISVKAAGKEAAFGAMWFQAKVDVNRDTRMVRVHTFDMIRVRFADATKENEQQLLEILERETESSELNFPYDDLLASLKTSETEQKKVEEFNNTPPKILFETVPAILVSIDGDPQWRDLSGTELERVINTPFFIVREKKGGTCWLNGGRWWFSSSDVKSGWSENRNPPSEVATAYQRDLEAQGTTQAEDPDTKDNRVPKIVMVTEPCELIVADGEPKFKSVGSDLLYMSNTESDVFVEIATQQYYTVLSGRWYRGKSMQGPWEYVKSDKLPAAFAMIPEDHEKGTVLPFVAGTNPATEAVLDAQVPQTAAIKRSEAKLEVQYDGDPKFEPVPGTDIQCAANTSKTVLLIKKKYYCCDNAIWFVADGARGPWVVCDQVPAEVQDIPPESPAYNVKYVYVYDSSPEIVYVGYTPAYMGCYPYYGSVVWGTGWYYHPWVSPYYYYPRPCTWGFHVNYNPWTGWSCGMSWSNGWMHFSVGFGGYGGWWGPCGYGWRPNYPYHGGRPVYVNRPININTGDINVGGGNRGGRGDQVAHRGGGGNNLYDRPAVKPAVEPRPSTKPGAGTGTRPSTRPAGGSNARPATKDNNMYVDRDGNVMQRDKNGNWSQRDNGQWKPVDGGSPSTRPSTPATKPATPDTRPATPQAKPATPQKQPAQSPSTQQMNRDYSARSRGTQQSQNYSRSQSRPASRPSGGGGRRR